MSKKDKHKTIVSRRYRNDPMFLQAPITMIFRIKVYDHEDTELRSFSMSGKSVEEVRERAEERYPDFVIKIEEID